MDCEFKVEAQDDTIPFKSSWAKQGDTVVLRYQTVTPEQRVHTIGFTAMVDADNSGQDRPVVFTVRLVDVNGDGLVSFAEYIFFITILSIAPEELEIAFRLYDVDGSGEMSLEE